MIARDDGHAGQPDSPQRTHPFVNRLCFKYFRQVIAVFTVTLLADELFTEWVWNPNLDAFGNQTFQLSMGLMPILT